MLKEAIFQPPSHGIVDLLSQTIPCHRLADLEVFYHNFSTSNRFRLFSATTNSIRLLPRHSTIWTVNTALEK